MIKLKSSIDSGIKELNSHKQNKFKSLQLRAGRHGIKIHKTAKTPPKLMNYFFESGRTIEELKANRALNKTSKFNG